jgi:SP family general alpha glucoside:H+ symporter-like MFS transporter
MNEPRNGSFHDQVAIEDLKEKNPYHSEILVNKEIMVNAFDGETKEHEMSMMQAVKMYPMACFWAFTMCFTIVSVVAPLRTPELTVC